jgi:hypothetical protein
MLRKNWQAIVSLTCIGLAVLLSGCVTGNSSLPSGLMLVKAGRVVPADLSPAQRHRLVMDCNKYDYYWSGDYIPANSFSSEPIRDVRAILIVPKSAKVNLVGRDWKRLIGCPWARQPRVPEMIAPVRGRDADRTRLVAVLDERGNIIGWIATSAPVGMSVLARGKTAGGRLSYEVSAVDRFDPNGPGGGSGSGGAGAGGGGGGGGGGGR